MYICICIYVYVYICVCVDALPSNKEYTGRNKVILDEAQAESNIAFLSPVYSILDGKAYTILYIIQYIDDIKHI